MLSYNVGSVGWAEAAILVKEASLETRHVHAPEAISGAGDAS